MGIHRSARKGRPPASLANRPERLEAVEAVLLAGGWSLRVVRQLAEQFGVHERQVRRDAETLREQWAAELPRSPLHAKGRVTRKLEAAQVQALREGRLDTHVRQLRLEAEVTGALAPIEVHVAVEDVAEMDPQEMARRVLDAYPRACAVLGLDPSAPPRPALDVVEVVDGDGR